MYSYPQLPLLSLINVRRQNVIIGVVLARRPRPYRRSLLCSLSFAFADLSIILGSSHEYALGIHINCLTSVRPLRTDPANLII